MRPDARGEDSLPIFLLSGDVGEFFFCFSLERPLEIKARFFVQKVKTDLKAKKEKTTARSTNSGKLSGLQKQAFC